MKGSIAEEELSDAGVPIYEAEYPDTRTAYKNKRVLYQRRGTVLNTPGMIEEIMAYSAAALKVCRQKILERL